MSFLFNYKAFGQANDAKMSDIKKELQNGVFMRTMNLQFVNSIDAKMLKKNYKQKIQLKPRDVPTYNFLRFSAFEYDVAHDAYVGKVFLSNRYLFWEFRKKYPNQDSLLQDKDGYFMMCKLYKYKKEFKLNIYPELVTNIYKKNFCSKKERAALGIDTLKMTNAKEYFEALKRVTLIKDNEASDFIAQPQNLSKNNVLETPFKEMGLRINFKKQIKIFKIKLNEQKQITALDLQYNKYAFSDDLIETNYSFEFQKNSTNLIPKKDTIVWILAGEMPEVKESKKAITENISEIEIGKTVFVKGEVEMFDAIESREIVQPRRTQNAQNWKVLEIREIEDNKKKLIWIKIEGEL